uniref:Uncharacterized protein n=1 Tax=Panagrellus redivivus TaxID=6233 RepID=A0A7E4V420_PANRE
MLKSDFIEVDNPVIAPFRLSIQREKDKWNFSSTNPTSATVPTAKHFEMSSSISCIVERNPRSIFTRNLSTHTTLPKTNVPNYSDDLARMRLNAPPKL